MWTKGHSFADDDSSIVVTPDGDLSFMSASIYQTGDYTCTASNTAGSISKTINVNVIQGIFCYLPAVAFSSGILKFYVQTINL